VGDAYLTDPVLRFIDPEGMPASFVALPNDEQIWRGRLFMAVWWLVRFEPLAWTMALEDEDGTDRRQWMLGTPDEVFISRWRAAQAEKATDPRRTSLAGQ
jgi:hypothetical protein